MSNDLLKKMRKILNKHDPIRLYCITKAFDEYDPEIKLIYIRFKKCKTFDIFVKEVYKIFIKMFSKYIAGNKKKYIPLCNDLFKLLKVTLN